jgi:hypothetical protein
LLQGEQKANQSELSDKISNNMDEMGQKAGLAGIFYKKRQE